MDKDTEVRDLRPDEVGEAVEVLARGMRDNPLHVAAYGDDPERRRRCHARLMSGLFRAFPDRRAICAIQHGRIVGVLGAAQPGGCQATPGQALRMLPGMLALGPRTAGRVRAWISAWGELDLPEDHVHLGPVAVDAPLQGSGIGTVLMEEHCRRLDDAGHVGYLETDRPENVRFYERFGYETVGERPVIGVPNWFMRRDQAASAGNLPA